MIGKPLKAAVAPLGKAAGEALIYVKLLFL